jgi:hypothetical protein
MPRASAKPNTFTIVEIYAASNTQSPLAKIYLEAPSAASDLKFEGTSLTHELGRVPHLQAAEPLSGVVVSGSGAIVFRATRIELENGAISIDHRLLSAGEPGSVLLCLSAWGNGLDTLRVCLG